MIKQEALSELADRLSHRARAHEYAYNVGNGDSYLSDAKLMLEAADVLRATPADVLERIAKERFSDPATDDLTVPLAIELSEMSMRAFKAEAALAATPAVDGDVLLALLRGREREALASVVNDIESKIIQLEHYRDNECQLEHARTIADGRILQARMDLHLVHKQWVALAPPEQPPLRGSTDWRAKYREVFNENKRLRHDLERLRDYININAPRGADLAPKFSREITELLASSPPEQPASPLRGREDDVLPCDVHLKPATIIRKGCKFSTLFAALSVRSDPDWDKSASPQEQPEETP